MTIESHIKCYVDCVISEREGRNISTIVYHASWTAISMNLFFSFCETAEKDLVNIANKDFAALRRLVGVA